MTRLLSVDGGVATPVSRLLNLDARPTTIATRLLNDGDGFATSVTRLLTSRTLVGAIRVGWGGGGNM